LLLPFQGIIIKALEIKVRKNGAGIQTKKITLAGMKIIELFDHRLRVDLWQIVSYFPISLMFF